MSEELNAKIKELTDSFLGSLKGKAKEYYESRDYVKQRTQETLKDMAELTLALATESDNARKASIKESISTGVDTLENDTVALLQGVKNEGQAFLIQQLRGLAAFAQEALPTVLAWVLKSLA